MCWRQVSKFQKTVLLVIVYLSVYLLISYAMTPETQVAFVADDIRVGDKYAYLFLVAPALPAFSDAEGADVIPARCGKCFITNNRGFLPMSEFDAVLVHGERRMLSEAGAFMDPDKRYLLEASRECIRSKFTRCPRQPTVTSFSSTESQDLCSLCQSLLKSRL